MKTRETLVKTLVDTGAVVSFSMARRLVATGGGKVTGDLVDKAVALAKRAHAGAVDKSGVDYYLHPDRVASLLVTYEPPETSTDEFVAVAILHDVVEDTDLTLEDLALLFPKGVVDGVDGMTRRPGESYNDYFRRYSVERIAKVVKKYDLMHNMDLTRMKDKVTVEDVRRTERYARTLKKLMKLEEL